MTGRHLDVGGARFRISPWRGDPTTAYLVPLSSAVTLTPSVLGDVHQSLTGAGYRKVFTAAVGVREQIQFEASGYEVHERLHLLAHDLQAVSVLKRRARLIRTGRRRDYDKVLELDHVSFNSFWSLDHVGLEEAVGATKRSRLRLVPTSKAWPSPSSLAGYTVAGRSGQYGYLQRLAVHPAVAGAGLGTRLIHDALIWCRTRGAKTVLVNTQEVNSRALALYERNGFVRQANGLAVLVRAIP